MQFQHREDDQNDLYVFITLKQGIKTERMGQALRHCRIKEGSQRTRMSRSYVHQVFAQWKGNFGDTASLELPSSSILEYPCGLE